MSKLRLAALLAFLAAAILTPKPPKATAHHGCHRTPVRTVARATARTLYRVLPPYGCHRQRNTNCQP